MGLRIDLVKPTPRYMHFSQVEWNTLFRLDCDEMGGVYMKLRNPVGLYNAVRLNDAWLASMNSNRRIVLLKGHLNAEDL